MTADDVKRVLDLQPHPREGGWFREIYKADAMLPASAYAHSAAMLHYNGPRRISSAIYYLLEPGNFSEMHRLQSDEMFHHYAGAPVEMLQLWPSGRMEQIVLGSDLLAGQRPLVLVPRGVWQGSRVLPSVAVEGSWSLLGCTVSPGFEYDDYQTGMRAELTESFPAAQEAIRALTRDAAH